MEDKAIAIRLLIKRFLIALPFFAAGCFLMIELSLLSIPGLVLMVIGGFILARPVSDLIGVSAGSLLFPGSSEMRPFLAFSIAESRVMEGNYMEALGLYRSMMEQDPDRLEVYTRIMKLAAVQMKDPYVFRDTFRTGLKNLKSLADRKSLAAEYKDLAEALSHKH